MAIKNPPNERECQDKIRQLYRYLMSEETDFVEAANLVREAIVYGAMTFDHMAEKMNTEGTLKPELHRDNLQTIQMAGAMLLCFGRGASDSLGLTVVN